MPNKLKLFKKIDRDLKSAAVCINDPNQCNKTKNLLSAAYTNWSELDENGCKGNEYAMDLYGLQEYLGTYQKDNYDSLDFLVDKIEEIRHSIQQKYNYIYSSDESDDESSSDEELTSHEGSDDESNSSDEELASYDKDNNSDEETSDSISFVDADDEENDSASGIYFEDLTVLQEKKPDESRFKYLNKPVTQKKKTGEKAFTQLLSCLLLDLNDFKSEIEYLIWYTAITLNLFMHNSTHRPIPGYGKSQERESKGLLLYYRSQSHHPHRKLHDTLTKEKTNTRRVSLLPRNSAHVKLIGNSAISTELKNTFNKLDLQGFPKKDQKIKPYFSLFLAYSGARANNLNVYIQALEHLTNDHDKSKKVQIISSKLKPMLPKDRLKKTKKIKSEDIITHLRIIQDKFKKLKEKTKLISFTPDLHSQMLKQRNARAKEIEQDCKEEKFQYINVQSTNTGTCIYIDIYPEFVNKIRESTNYSEGLTNVIIGFLGGLLNHHCQQENLYIHTDRRQSFGFLRSTLTDVGTMRIRLSLGLEPSTFNQIILKSLKELNTLLGEYDFTDRTNDEVKKYFTVCEKPKGEKATEKTGNCLLASMRSDEKKWLAFNEAHHYLNKQAKLNKKKYLKAAFKEYLDKFVFEKGENCVSKNDSLLTTTTAVIKPESNPSNINQSVIFNILKNLTIYAINYSEKLDKIADKDILLNLKNSYLHTLFKLHNNCDKALYLLAHMEEYEPSHLYAKATLLVENILEYLIALDALNAIQKKGAGEKDHSIKDLENSEKKYFASEFGFDPKDVMVYFTDGGQQAITTCILAMDMQLLVADEKNHSDKSVYIFDNSYYELNLFLDKVSGLRTTDIKSAKIFFSDITYIESIDLKKLPKAKVFVIDITNCPTLENEKLKELIKKLHEKNIWVVLVSSSIKHEELGLDKYQSGKMVFLPPKNESLYANVQEELSAVMEQAIHPAIASYLGIVKYVFQEKSSSAESKVSDVLSAKHLIAGSILKNKINLPPSENHDHFSEKTAVGMKVRSV